MRITVPHSRNKQEVKDAVTRSIEEIFTGVGVGPIVFTGRKKEWSGDTLNFSVTAKMGFLTTPIEGIVVVTERDVTVDVDLGLLGNLIPEEATKRRIEASIKGLLR